RPTPGCAGKKSSRHRRGSRSARVALGRRRASMNPAVWLPLWLGVCLGHTVVMVFTMNWLYGCPFPKKVMKPIRRIYAVLILAGCGFFTWTLFECGFDWGRWLAESSYAVAAYTWVCWLAAFLVFPLATLYNRLIRNHPVLLSNHTQCVD